MTTLAKFLGKGIVYQIRNDYDIYSFVHGDNETKKYLIELSQYHVLYTSNFYGERTDPSIVKTDKIFRKQNPNDSIPVETWFRSNKNFLNPQNPTNVNENNSDIIYYVNPPNDLYKNETELLNVFDRGNINFYTLNRYIRFRQNEPLLEPLVREMKLKLDGLIFSHAEFQSVIEKRVPAFHIYCSTGSDVKNILESGNESYLIDRGFFSGVISPVFYFGKKSKTGCVLRIEIPQNTPILFLDTIGRFVLPTNTMFHYNGEKTLINSVQVYTVYAKVLPVMKKWRYREYENLEQSRKTEVSIIGDYARKLKELKFMLPKQFRDGQELEKSATVISERKQRPREMDPSTLEKYQYTRHLVNKNSFMLKRIQQMLIDSLVPVYTHHGKFYFKLNENGINKKLVGCEWVNAIEEGNIQFPKPGEGNSIIFSVNDDHFKGNYEYSSGGKQFIIKAFHRPIYNDNGNLTEAFIYTQIISRMIEYAMTPHIITPYAHIICSDFFTNLLEKLQSVEQKNPLLLAKIEEMNLHLKYNEFLSEREKEIHLNEIHLLCIEKVEGKVTSFEDFLKRYYRGDINIKDDDITAILFQIIYTLYIFNLCGLRHNDLHLENILIQEMDEPFNHKYTVQSTNFYINSIYNVYIIDYDRSSVINSPLLKDDIKYKTPAGERSIYNTTLMSTIFCDAGGMCNGYNPKIDTFRVLTKIIESNVAENSTKNWLSDLIYSWVDVKLIDGATDYGYFAEELRASIEDYDYYPPDNKTEQHWMMSNEQILLSNHFEKLRKETNPPPNEEFKFRIPT